MTFIVCNKNFFMVPDSYKGELQRLEEEEDPEMQDLKQRKRVL